MAKKTDIMDLAKQIDSQLSQREEALENAEKALEEAKGLLASKEAKFKIDEEELAKKQSEFGALSAEVDHKFSKIRNDVQLSEDLRAQAIQAKEIEKLLNEVKEERGLTEYNLGEIEKRERAVALREQTYKEEIAKEFATKYLKI